MQITFMVVAVEQGVDGHVAIDVARQEGDKVFDHRLRELAGPGNRQLEDCGANQVLVGRVLDDRLLQGNFMAVGSFRSRGTQPVLDTHRQGLGEPLRRLLVNGLHACVGGQPKGQVGGSVCFCENDIGHLATPFSSTRNVRGRKYEI